MNIRLHIERIIFEGAPVEFHHRGQLQSSIEAELTRLLTTQGIGSSFQSNGTIPYLTGGTVQLSEKSEAAHLGTQIAHTVYGSLSR